MSDEYKRQIDRWIKLSVIATPLLSGAASWGVIKATISNLSDRVATVETWKAAQQDSALVRAHWEGQTAEAQKETNRRLEHIEVILDSRLKGK